MAKKYKVEYKLVECGNDYKNVQHVIKTVESNAALDALLKNVLTNPALEYVAIKEIKTNKQILEEAGQGLI